jgi:hypothetical protein
VTHVTFSSDSASSNSDPFGNNGGGAISNVAGTLTVSNTDPELDPAGPANNGGLTQTIAVEAGSPAINAGNRAGCKSAKNIDQRGFVRLGTGSTSCTIDAYEFNSPGPPTH